MRQSLRKLPKLKAGMERSGMMERVQSNSPLALLQCWLALCHVIRQGDKMTPSVTRVFCNSQKLGYIVWSIQYVLCVLRVLCG